MKTKITIFMLLLVSSIISKAQETPIVPPTPAKSNADKGEGNRIFGLGFKTFNLTSELMQSPNIWPGNKIIVTINPHKNIRLQPEVGYYQAKVHDKTVNDDLIDKAYSMGIGVFGMWQKEKTNLYAGLKYTFTKSIDEGIQSTFNPNPPYNTIYSVGTTTISNNSYGVVIGGEYLLGKHFSVGSEIGFLRSVSNETYSASTINNGVSKHLLTETNLIVRFYF